MTAEKNTACRAPLGELHFVARRNCKCISLCSVKTALQPANSAQSFLRALLIADLPTATAITEWLLPNLHFVESIDLRVPCCYLAPFFSSTPCCQQMLSFAGAALDCPFTPLSSTSEGEKCLFSREIGADVAFDTNARLPDGDLSAFNRPQNCGAEVGRCMQGIVDRNCGCEYDEVREEG